MSFAASELGLAFTGSANIRSTPMQSLNETNQSSETSSKLFESGPGGVVFGQGAEFDDGMQSALLANSGTLIRILQAQVARLTAENDALATELAEARDQIRALTGRSNR